jgi:hypothetical protein
MSSDYDSLSKIMQVQSRCIQTEVPQMVQVEFETEQPNIINEFKVGDSPKIFFPD